MRMRKFGLTAASIAIGVVAAVAAPATAQPAPIGTSQGGSAAAVASAAAWTWQPTGDFSLTKRACLNKADYYLSASNVHGYKCVHSGGAWEGWVLAD
ncbi:hypothetical protein ACFRFU_48305 [Streptomyces sp. NPDC056704]|uniref:hypothetical protein n=1 Tax=Streptomyces sp. NPDC056704 TaxID=3345917 RepID=UPI0036CC45D6